MKLCEMNCRSKVGGRGATEEEEKEEEEPGVSEPKQKPHTKMWGNIKIILIN